MNAYKRKKKKKKQPQKGRRKRKKKREISRKDKKKICHPPRAGHECSTSEKTKNKWKTRIEAKQFPIGAKKISHNIPSEQ